MIIKIYNYTLKLFELKKKNYFFLLRFTYDLIISIFFIKINYIVFLYGNKQCN